MHYVILTDLEGAAGVDSFSQTRTTDNARKGPAMKQLAREVNACVSGIRAVDPDASVDVIDGHGTGGLFPEDLADCRYINLAGRSLHELLEGSDAMMFVGQHAMAGTVAAPLNHTYSSRDIMYYRLNGMFIGEFGARALIAGTKGVPVIFLSGDDKAAAEAAMFVPGIVTAVTKQGLGIESAIHLSSEEACRLIRDRATAAASKRHGIAPFTAIRPPYEFEARYYEPISDPYWLSRPDAVLVDERTVRVTTANLAALPL